MCFRNLQVRRGFRCVGRGADDGLGVGGYPAGQGKQMVHQVAAEREEGQDAPAAGDVVQEGPRRASERNESTAGRRASPWAEGPPRMPGSLPRAAGMRTGPGCPARVIVICGCDADWSEIGQRMSPDAERRGDIRSVRARRGHARCHRIAPALRPEVTTVGRVYASRTRSLSGRGPARRPPAGSTPEAWRSWSGPAPNPPALRLLPRR